MGIYVEICIRGPMETLWQRTQEPALHQRWDLRFSEITYLPRPDADQPQRFLYATRIGLGLVIRGEGESTGTRDDEHGRRTSALKFWSDDPRSLIRDGAGYWQYVPDGEAIRFITWYDYQTRHGPLGRAIDALIFRPLMGWATAWSFDRLRLWIERGLDPALTLQRALVYAVARLAVAFIWLYHGLVPKLLVAHPDELALLVNGGLPATLAPALLIVVGGAEVLFGLLVLIAWHARWPLWLTIVGMVLATISVALSTPAMLVAAFNPVSLNAAVIALASIGLLTHADLPSARHCRRARPEPPT